MSSAGDMGLKEYQIGNLRSNELIFGKAICFPYISFHIDDILDSDRYFVKNLELMKMHWSGRIVQVL